MFQPITLDPFLSQKISIHKNRPSALLAAVNRVNQHTVDPIITQLPTLALFPFSALGAIIIGRLAMEVLRPQKSSLLL